MENLQEHLQKMLFFILRYFDKSALFNIFSKFMVQILICSAAKNYHLISILL
jgi:hypothetical protein